jgi:hypothetical protein
VLGDLARQERLKRGDGHQDAPADTNRAETRLDVTLESIETDAESVRCLLATDCEGSGAFRGCGHLRTSFGGLDYFVRMLGAFGRTASGSSDVCHERRRESFDRVAPFVKRRLEGGDESN